MSGLNTDRIFSADCSERHFFGLRWPDGMSDTHMATALPYIHRETARQIHLTMRENMQGAPGTLRTTRPSTSCARIRS